jgi:hypothetical protein
MVLCHNNVVFIHIKRCENMKKEQKKITTYKTKKVAFQAVNV